MADSALVLGGGGVAGIAWMTGLLLGLVEEGVDLRQVSRLIGTSAGSTVAAQMTSKTGLDDLFQRQVDETKQVAELVPDPSALALLVKGFPALMQIADPDERARQIGRMALETRTVEEAARRGVIAERLPSHEWPDRALQIVAVDTATGAMIVLERSTGVSLVDAVAASCAVPGIWPPVTLGVRRYMDGGTRSFDNADLAAGAGSVVVISPMGTSGMTLPGGVRLSDQVFKLEQGGAKVRIIEPDEPSRAAMGDNPFSPLTRKAAAAAGRVQGRMLAASFSGFF